MNEIRAKFEEIWPVPRGIAWSMNIGAYVCNDEVRITQELINKCAEMDARLDTFTRCQESMGPVLSIVDELIMEIEGLAVAAYGCVPQQSQDILDSAKQIIRRG